MDVDPKEREVRKKSKSAQELAVICEEIFDRKEGEAELIAAEPAMAMERLYAVDDRYLHVQRTDTGVDYYEQGRFMKLDLTARRNLELTETLRGKEKKGSLLWVLDKTKTPMGARCLRSWLERPLLSVTAICKRNSAVAALVDNTIVREELIAAMTGLGDMERLIGRIVYGMAFGGREVRFSVDGETLTVRSVAPSR